MANRYWVGGPGTWDATDTTHWSTTSGGSSGASVPSSADVVIFNDASYATTGLVVTISGDVYCAGITSSRTGGKYLSLDETSSTAVLHVSTGTINGTVIGGTYFIGFAGTMRIEGTVTGVGYFALPAVVEISENAYYISDITGGGVSVDGYDIRLNSGSNLYIKSNTLFRKITSLYTTGTKPTVLIGYNNATSDLTLVGSPPEYDCLSGEMQIVSQNSGNRLYMSTAYNDCSASLSNTTIDKLTFTPAAAGDILTLSGSGTITDFVSDGSTISHRLKFAPTSNITFGAFDVDGGVSSTVYIESSVPSTRAGITKSGGGTVTTTYVEVKDMQPSPDDTWISTTGAVDAGNNYRWYFGDFDKPTSCLFFGSHA